MRILHIIQRYWPAQGGAERHMAELSTRLAADGHDVTVLTTDALDIELFWNPTKRRLETLHEEHDGVEIIRLPLHHLPVAQLGYPAVRRLLWLMSKSRIAPLPVMEQLARFTPWTPDLRPWLAYNDEPFDLVAGMTICFEPLLSAGLDFARQRGIPFVAYPLTHLGAGAAPGDDAVSSFYTMRHQVDLVVRSDGAVLQTPAEADFYIARGLPAERTRIVGPGVTPADVAGGDGARFRRAHAIAGPLVTGLGAMSYDKGMETLVEAVAQLWAQGRQVELALAGAILEPFQYFLDQLPQSVRSRVRVLGSIDEAAKRDLLAATDVLALPSRTDSFGITYLEAWCYGKPVIGADAWGIRDVITHGEDGLLVPFGDADALAVAIARLLDHPDQAAAMGQRGRANVLAHHTWAQKAQKVEKFYAELVGERGS
ncbi:MAG: glycosyltransferase family 4 protein [Caldilineaceae bacterium]|nr:glycosyltransferase family 4 protein [Caldilineaceae bacterium]